MIAHLWLWLTVVAVGSARVVRQPDGIISIITELEPEKVPVNYVQAVSNRADRREPVVVEDIPSPPLGEGEFRVKSTKIRVVNPETGFKTVHEAVAPKEVHVLQTKPNVDKAKPIEESERRNDIRAESANDMKVIYPSRSRYSSDINDSPPRFNDNGDFRNTYRRQRKPGQYGRQTPRRDNMVITDKTTRIKNNDEPPQVIKETIVRPVTQQDDIVTRKKSGKPGRFVRYKSQNPSIDIKDSDKFVKQRSQSPSLNNEKPGRYGKYRSKNPSTDFDRTRQFKTSQLPVPNPVPAVGEVFDNSNAGSESLKPATPRKTKKEFSTSTMVRFPDGYAQDNEKRVESSSNYKTGSNSRNNYRSPSIVHADSINRKLDGTDISPSKNSLKDRVELDQHVPQESSYVSSGLDDGLVDDPGVIYPGGGYDDGVGVIVGGGDAYGGGFEKEKHFEKDKGKHYVADHHSAHGAKGQKGFKNEEAFSKGQSEKHGHDEKKGYAQEKEGEKKSHLDQSSQYAAGHKASDGEKTSDYHKEKGHRKGHKKSGFRTVSHKDEYNKKEEFFDEEHDIGNVHKEGHNSQHHSDKHGGKDKKAFLDAGHHQASRGHEGGHESGHGYNQHKGHHNEKGLSGHFGHEEDYGKKSGHKEGEVHGHSEYGGGFHG